MTALVTGASGFIGTHMVRHLAGLGRTVMACSRRPGRVDHPLVRWIPADVRDAAKVEEVLAAYKPDEIYHFAAQSLPRESWDKAGDTFSINVNGTVTLLEAARKLVPTARLLVAGSSSSYAPPRNNEPLIEEALMDPSSPYGISKVAADWTARLYARKYNLAITVARPFFIIGPEKIGDVCSDFARGIVAIEQGRSSELPVGNLSVVRDFVDYRDGLEAMTLIAARGVAGEAYNIGLGKGTSIGELLEIFRGLAGKPIQVREQPALLRPLDDMIKVGNPSKLMALGWSPRWTIRDSVRDILDYWRGAGHTRGDSP